MLDHRLERIQPLAGFLRVLVELMLEMVDGRHFHGLCSSWVCCTYCTADLAE
jgi:hypothetical protein